jgi:RimJ/RimL family protein N-acetyltransferase
LETQTFTADDDGFAGDPAWRVVRTLRDGSAITIRPIQPEDREELRREFARTSPESRYLRFLGVVGELTDKMLTYLTCVDQHDHIALVATMTSPDLKSERGVGVGRVIRSKKDHHIAEAAITVVDDMHRLGIGSALAFEMARAAKARGIRTIRAEVLEGNAAMRGILENAGALRVDSGDQAGALSYDLAIEYGPPSSRIVDVLRGAAQTMAMSIRRLVPPE